MRIDQKYFNLFVGIVGGVAIIAIVFFNVRYATNQRAEFIEAIGDGKKLYDTWLVNVSGTDSVKASNFHGQFVIIDFWATWSGPSIQSHIRLWETIERSEAEVTVLAATIKDGGEDALLYARQHPYDFIYLNGTDVFQSLFVPGVPTQIAYNPKGELIYVRVGYNRPSDYNALMDAFKGE
jgi:thiol-disulfide isomerase/thioredoxin